MNRVYICKYAVNHALGTTVKEISESLETGKIAYRDSPFRDKWEFAGTKYPFSRMEIIDIKEDPENHFYNHISKEAYYLIDTINRMEWHLSPNLFVSTTMNSNIKPNSLYDYFNGFNNQLALSIANYFRCTGRVVECDSSCAGGLSALIQAVEFLRNKDKPMTAIVGVVEVFNENIMKLLYKLRVLSPTMCNPTEPDRNGTVYSEGAVSLFLCNQAFINLYHIKPLTTIVDSSIYHFTDLVNIDVNQFAYTLKLLDTYGIKQITGHLTGTVKGDELEMEAYKKVFKNKVPIKTYKKQLGHTLAVSGLLELILDIENNSNCYILKNAFGLGGSGASVVIHI